MTPGPWTWTGGAASEVVDSEREAAGDFGSGKVRTGEDMVFILVSPEVKRILDVRRLLERLL